MSPYPGPHRHGGSSVFTVSASDPGTGDWPMWGGTPDRNMVSNMKGLPTNWDVAKKVNVKWVAALGSQTYGNAVVAGGQVYIGTNNEGLRDPKVTGDKGTLMAFRESDGEFLWQAVSDKLVSGRVNDWPYQGVCSSPLVEGDRLYTARIVVLLSFIALCVCDTSAKPTAREYLKRGDIQLSRNNLVQAISNYTKAMS